MNFEECESMQKAWVWALLGIDTDGLELPIKFTILKLCLTYKWNVIMCLSLRSSVLDTKDKVSP